MVPEMPRPDVPRDSEIIRLYSVWALWRVDRLNTINKETFYKREVSQNVIHEFDLLIK